MLESKEIIFQNLCTIFSDCNVSNQDIFDVLNKNDFDLNKSIKDLSKIHFSNTIAFVHHSEFVSSLENTKQLLYESLPNVFYEVEKNIQTGKHNVKEIALNLTGVKYPGITQILLRKFAALKPGFKYQLKLTLGSEDYFESPEERDKIKEYVANFCIQMGCTYNSNFGYNAQLGILCFNFSPVDSNSNDSPQKS